MRVLFSTLLIVLVTVVSLTAQNFSDYQDVIYLKNGSVIKGIIIEEIPGTSVKIQSGQNIFHYELSEIAKFTRERLTEEEEKKQRTNFSFKPKGFVFNYELGLTDLIYNGDQTPMASIILSHGYQFNPHIYLGLAAGGEFSSQGTHSVPVYLDFRSYLMKTRATPMLGMGLGYQMLYSSGGNSFGSSNSIINGFLINPTVGVRVAVNEKVALGLNLGYRFTGIPLKASPLSSSVQLSANHGIIVRMCVSF